MLKLAITTCIIAQALSAPSGCLDLCGSPGGLSTQHEALQDLHTLTDELRRDYNRPGNWTEHKDYKTPDGAGKVHEERGQVVKGNSQMRYYKKNYAASYGSGAQLHDSGLRSEDSTLLQQNNLLSSHNNYGRNSYNEQYHQSGRSSRIEDFGDRADASLTQESSGVKGHVGSDNWNRHNSYVADGGHGKVYEEEGQFTQGPAKVHYYKKNYTSSYGSGGAVPVVSIPDISTDLQTQTQHLQRQLEEISREVHQDHHSQVSQNTNNNGNQYQSANDNDSRHDQHSQSAYNQKYQSPAAGTREEHFEEQSSRKEHRVQSHGSYVPTQTNYVIPDEMQTAESHQSYQQEVYRPLSQVTLQVSPSYPTQGHQYQSHDHEYQSQGHYQNQHRTQDHQTSNGLVHVPLGSGSGYNNYRDESRVYSQHQQVRDHSEVGQTHLENDRNRQNNYGQYGEHQQVHSQSGRRVEDQWNSSGHRTEDSYPQQVSSSNQRLEDFGAHATRGSEGSYRGLSDQSGNRYVSGSSSSYHQRYESHSGSQGNQNGHFHTGVLDLGHGAADCDTEQLGSNYQRRYRRDLEHQNEDSPLNNEEQLERKARDVDFGQETQQFEDLTQLTQGFADYTQQQQTGHLEHDQDRQQTEDLGLSQQTQQFEDLTQQTQGYGGYEQQEHSGRFNQQQTGNLELGQQTQQVEDLTQQTQRYGGYRQQQHTGQLEVGNQHQQQHIEEPELSQQTQQVEDLTQQTQRYGGYRQQEHSGRFNQQHHQQAGNLDLSQQTQQVADLTQQTYELDDFYQQHSEKPEFGEHNPRDQTARLEYGQHQQVEDLSQQTQELDDNYRQSGNHEFGRHQQSTSLENGRHIEDFGQYTGRYHQSQQTAPGNIEFGQPNQQNIHTEVVQPAPKPVSRHHILESTSRSDMEPDSHPSYGLGQEIRPVNRPMGVKGGGGRFFPQPSYHNQYDLPSTGVLSLEDQHYPTQISGSFRQTSSLPEDFHNEKYQLRQAHEGQAQSEMNPWDARQTPTEEFGVQRARSSESLSESQTQYPEGFSTTPAPGFWKKVGQKITTGFEKVKAKVNDAFG